MVNDEERLIRIDPGPELGNFTGFPMNAAGTAESADVEFDDSGDPRTSVAPARGVLLDARSEPEPAHRRDHRPDQPARDRVHPDRVCSRARTARSGSTAVRIRPITPSDLWTGFSTGEWENGTLHVTTTHFKPMFIQRNGDPGQPVRRDARVLHPPRRSSDAHHRRLTIPVYLEEPMIRTSTFRWNPGAREGGDHSSGRRRGTPRTEARRRAALSARLDASRIRRGQQAAIRRDARRERDAVSGVRGEAEGR